MKAVISLCLVTVLTQQASAGPRTSANYSISTDTIDVTGGRAASSRYTSHGSAGGVAGRSAIAAPAVMANAGYIAQLFEVTGLALNSVSPNLNETATVQLGAWQLLDDATFLTVPGASIAWSVNSGPFTGIDAAGLATAGVVYQDTPATVQGTFGPDIGLLNLTVIDSIPDNFGAYAGDGLDDAWQFQYFGLDNPNAAPGIMSDGSGLTNLFKYTAGLIPNNTASRFLLEVQPVNGQPAQKNIVFTPSLLDRHYTIEFSTNLAGWNTLSGPFAGNGSIQTVTDTDAGTRNFYRVLISKP